MGRRAVERCLQRSRLAPASIDAVHVHGTSTQQNDRMEACVIAQMLAKEVPVIASKGATGHTLGASGALVVALSLLSLKQQALLPCVGLREADFELHVLSHELFSSFGIGFAMIKLSSRRLYFF